MSGGNSKSDSGRSISNIELRKYIAGSYSTIPCNGKARQEFSDKDTSSWPWFCMLGACNYRQRQNIDCDSELCLAMGLKKPTNMLKIFFMIL